MTTAQELIDFAKQNNIYIAPYRDPADWVEKIDTVGNGYCLCVPDRKCPCPEAVQEIQEFIAKGQAEDAVCACSFYCSKEHYDKHAKTMADAAPKARGEPAGTEPAKAEKDLLSNAVDAREIKTPEVKKIIIALQTARKSLIEQKPDEAIKILENESKDQKCGLCGQFLNEIVNRIKVSAITCALGEEICDLDLYALYSRIRDLEHLYKNVDDEIQRDQSSIVPQQTPQRPTVARDGTGRDAYHTCVSMLSSSPELKRIFQNRGKLFGFVSSYCAKTASKNKPYSLEDAIDQARRSVGS